ncbi:hypothetical protein HKX17_18410 [Sulfitobacter sp. KE34]|uniref:hypothetical protein n=1 Tax=unclassified Sulfitobacter TaxID=196795 RepID=UPI0023E0EABB|nr:MULTISPECIES: hypothetical protein [unclassified Sulfitobacter]MDF3352121.1 hypothetical protein [Sulfitobacter sp. KE12]MDF3355777.1 hypothetical protein [Sulfitobacter sp. KE27]MDF3359412.1 hypothetical protein [Sulfitobacter sp. KE33]MDF3366836.1 hypothetical protein [Sulfitobacter sp. Ks34]MDF3370459.1 hypothetical protein [Sulfitobacter sp. Ks43]
MPEGYFSGRKAKAPTEIEVELAEHGLRETAARMDTICVKRRYGDYGIAKDKGEGDQPICIYPRTMAPSSSNLTHEDGEEIERFATWRDAAKAGWVVD